MIDGHLRESNMITSTRGWIREIAKDRRWGTISLPSLLPILAAMVALLLMGMLEALAPSLITRIFSTSYTAQTLANSVSRLIIGALLITIIIILRQDELAATIVIAVHLYIDWYLELQAVALIMALALLVIFFLARSPEHPWVKPRALWLWALFLVLAMFPAIAGEHRAKYDIFYYPNLFLGALIFFWLGTVVARNSASVRTFFRILSVFGTLIAVHTIILATTGTFLFRSSYFDEYLLLASNFAIAPDVNVYRLGAFFVDPNWNGTFFAVMLCIPLGLFFASSFFLEKILYLVEMFVLLIALLFTFSGGALIGAITGVVVFAALVGRTSYRIQICLFIVAAATVLLVGFPSQLNLLQQHLSRPSELMLRLGAWRTALLVIKAYPLTGTGLGLQAYAERSLPYTLLAQAIPLAHPHDSYLELGAMAGLPVLLTFVALIVSALWLALRNWARADGRARILLAGGIAAVIGLSVNSGSINGWTLPPLAAIGWLVLGVISSPLLARSGKGEMTREESNELLTNNSR